MSKSEIAKALDLSEEDINSAEKMSDVNFLSIPEAEDIGKPGEKVYVTVVSDKIERIDTKYTENAPAIKVAEEDGIESYFIMASKSARMQFFKLLDKHKTLKDKKIAIWKELYMHEKYNKTQGYRIIYIGESEE